MINFNLRHRAEIVNLAQDSAKSLRSDKLINWFKSFFIKNKPSTHETDEWLSEQDVNDVDKLLDDYFKWRINE